MGFRQIAIFITMIALIFGGVPGPVIAQTEEWPNCENFLGQDDAQATYDADPQGDPFGLDGNSDGEACETDVEYGTSDLVDCRALDVYANAQSALHGLYDHTRNEGDPYGLDPDGNGFACDGGGGGGEEEEPLDGPPPTPDPEPVATDEPPRGDPEPPVTTEPAAPPVDIDDTIRPYQPRALDTLEARLDARLAALEAQFAAFEVRAEDGFGTFPDTEDESSSGGSAAPIVVSSTDEPLATAQLSDEGMPFNQVTRAQRGITAADDAGGSARNDSRQRGKDGKNDRAKERQGKKKKARDQYAKRDQPSRDNDDGK